MMTKVGGEGNSTDYVHIHGRAVESFFPHDFIVFLSFLFFFRSAHVPCERDGYMVPATATLCRSGDSLLSLSSSASNSAFLSTAAAGKAAGTRRGIYETPSAPSVAAPALAPSDGLQGKNALRLQPCVGNETYALVVGGFVATDATVRCVIVPFDIVTAFPTFDSDVKRKKKNVRLWIEKRVSICRP